MLEKVAEKHKEWVRMAISLGCPLSTSEDVVQECYLRLHKYRETAESKVISPEGEVNSWYMFGVVRNTLRTYMKTESFYIPFEDFYYEKAQEDVSEDYERKYQELMDNIRLEVDSWGAYNSKLFNLYFKTDLSMRKISDGTDIGLTHIFSSLTRFREKIQQKFGEDFNNLKQ